MNRLGIITMGLALIVAGAAPTRAADVFHGCSSNTTGRVRNIQVNSVPTCRSTETLRTWGQGGLQSCQVETFRGTCDPGTATFMDTSCATGFATGASAIWMTPFGQANNGNFYFYARSGNLWTTITYNDTASAQDFEVRLQCCE